MVENKIRQIFGVAELARRPIGQWSFQRIPTASYQQDGVITYINILILTLIRRTFYLIIKNIEKILTIE